MLTVAPAALIESAGSACAAPEVGRQPPSVEHPSANVSYTSVVSHPAVFDFERTLFSAALEKLGSYHLYTPSFLQIHFCF